MNQLRLCSAEVHASMRSLSPQLSHVLVGNCRSFVAEALRYVVGDRHLVNLVYRPTSAEGASKDNQFSRRSMEERWLAGNRDTVQALRHPGVLERAAGCDSGFFVFDFPRDGG
jgi:hypothetical protein